MARSRSTGYKTNGSSSRNRGLALVLTILAILGGVGGLIGLSPLLSPTTPVLFDQSSQISQASTVQCASINGIPSCSSIGPNQAPVNPTATNTGISMPIAYIWANGFATTALPYNAAATLAILGSQNPTGPGLSWTSLSSTGPGGGGVGCTPGNCIGSTGTYNGNTCQSPPGGLPNGYFCSPNSIPSSSYQLAVSLNGATKRIDQIPTSVQTNFGLTGSSGTALANFAYTTTTGNYTVTQTWLVQRYLADVRLQIQGDTITIDAKCLLSGPVFYVNENCSQLIGSALTTALTQVNQYDKATGYVDIDIGYPGTQVQQGELDDFLGAWTAPSSCLASASSAANSPVINNAVSLPGGASISLPACSPGNTIPFAPASCNAAPGQLNMAGYTNSSVANTPLANLCSKVKLRLGIASFGPTYKVQVFNQNGGDSQTGTCYQIISANAIAGTQQGCDWGIKFDQGLTLDVPIVFDYLSYFTSRNALKISCGSACGGTGSGQGTGVGNNGQNTTKTGSTLTITVTDQFGIPLSGETVTLTTASGTSTGPNPCTTGLNGQCPQPFNILAGTWTVTAAENGYTTQILFFTLTFPPIHNLATAQIIVTAGSSQVSLVMASNLQFFFILGGVVVGIPILLLIIFITLRVARGAAQNTPQGRVFGTARKAAKTLSRNRSKK